ncbi:MAG: hypothetical protein BA066_04530 [Candidatus Korarchaeota archaeon NZ13-K]|nr:MAG: hypothetical protein BA066_04530 [Candidatus Korarchaeota archaeon NZ13-K]
MGSLRIPSPELLLGKRTLIVGRVRSGKTRLTAEILRGFMGLVGAGEITVIDLAPERGGLGLSLRAYLGFPEGLRYLRPASVRAPRLEGRDAEEVLRLARENEEYIRPILLNFLENPTKILVMNDMTIYLHAGDLGLILECMGSVETFLGNAHYGRGDFDDKGSGLNERERLLIEELMRRVDVILKLSP